MSETGKAAVFFDTGKDFEMREYPVPDPEPDAIVVRNSQVDKMIA